MKSDWFQIVQPKSVANIMYIAAVFPLRIFGPSQNDPKWIHFTRWKSDYGEVCVATFLVNSLKTLFLICNSHIAVRQIADPLRQNRVIEAIISLSVLVCPNPEWYSRQVLIDILCRMDEWFTNYITNNQ